MDWLGIIITSVISTLILTTIVHFVGKYKDMDIKEIFKRRRKGNNLIGTESLSSANKKRNTEVRFSKLKKVLCILGIIAVIVTIQYLFPQFSSSDKYTKKELIQMTPSILNTMADKINKNTPMTLDKEIVLTNVVAMGNRLIHNYQLINYSEGQIDTEHFLSTSKKNVIERFCTNPETKLVREIGAISFKYVYYDKNNKYIGQNTIRTSQCD